jgi:Methyltransferase domain
MNPGSPTRDIACRLCGEPARWLFQGRLLEHRVDYFECNACDYVQTETPFWLEQAYAQAINSSDTGILRRNERNARLVIRVLAMLGALKASVIDCAGGYGLLVRLLRDRGVDAWWHDPYCDNLVARGFEARSGQRARLATAFEALEHFVDPVGEMRALLARADNVLVSTDLIASPAPQPAHWWYYGSEHGQHVGFFRRRTLQALADKLGRHVVSDGKSFHLFTTRPVAHWRWMLARRSTGLSPLIARLSLRSKVWSDHAAMSRRDAP